MVAPTRLIETLGQDDRTQDTQHQIQTALTQGNKMHTIKLHVADDISQYYVFIE